MCNNQSNSRTYLCSVYKLFTFFSIYPVKNNLILMKKLFRISAVILLTILIHSCKEESSLPRITTTDVTIISYTSVTTGGIVTYDGGASIISRGVCWGTSENPTTTDNKTSDGTGTGTFTSSLDDLSGDNTYYAKAYATNIIGTAYGKEITINLLNINQELEVKDIEGNTYHSVKI